MEGLNKIINNIIAPALNKSIRENPGDYTDKATGLLICGKCHTNKQTVVNLGNGPRVINCSCACEIEKYNTEKRQKEIKQQVERLQRLGFNSEAMKYKTFSNSVDGGKIIEVANNYCNNFKEFYKLGKGLLLWGPNSTGKTYAAACIVNYLIEHGQPALLTNFATLANELDAKWNERQQVIDKLNQFKLVAIDDLGAERNDSRMRSYIYQIIDGRTMQGKPLIVTTNMDIKEITAPNNIDNARIYERLLGACHPIEVNGPSRRRQELKKSYEDVNKLLGL